MHQNPRVSGKISFFFWAQPPPSPLDRPPHYKILDPPLLIKHRIQLHAQSLDG